MKGQETNFVVGHIEKRMLMKLRCFLIREMKAIKMKNDDMLRRVKTIIDAAVQRQEELVADYGLTAEQITNVQADYDRFRELNGQPREYRIKSAVATQSPEELFTETNNLLTNQLDNLMKVFKRRDPNFYNGYLKARMVVDY